MSALLDAPPLVGATRPRIARHAAIEDTAGPDVTALIALAGEAPDASQQYVLDAALARRRDGGFHAVEVCLIESRQNGKNWILEGRVLAGVFLFGEKQIVFSAHRFTTLKKTHRALVEKIRAVPAFFRRVLGWKGQGTNEDLKGFKSNGNELSIEFSNGARIDFLVRSEGNVRGFTGDLIVLDEAYDLDQDELDAMIPAIAARTAQGSPQIWYTSSAARARSDVLRRLRERGTTPWDGVTNAQLCYLEFSASEDTITDPDDPDFDAEALALAVCEANPGIGSRLSLEYVLSTERSALGDEGFRVERLGIPAPVGSENFLRSTDWAKCRDEALIEKIDQGLRVEQDLADLHLAVDVSPDRSTASIGLAGLRADGTVYIEVIDTGAGPEWITETVAPIWARRSDRPLLIAGSSTAADLAADLRRRDVRVRLMKQADYAAACGRITDAVRGHRIAHSGQPALDRAVDAALPSSRNGRPWTWKRVAVDEDITPWVACTLAAAPLWREATTPDSDETTEPGSRHARRLRPRNLRTRGG